MSKKLFEAASRREFLLSSGKAGMAAAGGVVLGKASGLFGSSAQAATKPNILLILTDEERDWFWLPKGFDFAGHFPARQWLRSQGVRFTNYHVHTNPCSPSRSTIFTGQHTDTTQVFDNVIAGYQADMKAALPTVGDLLKREGYRTAYRGKWHLFAEGNSLVEYGFDDWEPGDFDDIKGTEGREWDGEIAGSAADWITGAAADPTSPWFMSINFVNPHDISAFPNYYSMDCANRIDVESLSDYQQLLRAEDVPANYADDLSTKPGAHAYWRSFYNSFKGEVDHNSRTVWQQMLNHYLYYMKQVDTHVLTVLNALADSGQLNNTVIVFTSDHGELGGAHGLRAKGPECYAESRRVPLVVVDPRTNLNASHRGVETKAFAGAIDLAPTLLRIANPTVDLTALELRGVDLYTKVLATSSPATLTEKAARSSILFTYDARQGSPISGFGIGRGYLRGILGYNSANKLMKYARYFVKGKADSAPAGDYQELYDYSVDGFGEVRNRADQFMTLSYKKVAGYMNDQLNTLITKEMRNNNASGSVDLKSAWPAVGCK